MLKSIFCKIMSDKQQRQKMNSLENKNQIYKLFCQNGYTKSYNEFEKEMDIFLNSEDSKKLLNNEFEELSDEMLEMIAGGVNVKRAATAGIAVLLTTFTVGAIGNQILSQSNTDTTSSPTQTVSTFDNSNENTKQSKDDTGEQAKDDNGGGGAEQTSNNRPSPNAKNRTFKFGQKKGPRNGGSSAVHHKMGPNGGGASANHNIGPNGGGPANHNIGPNGGSNGPVDQNYNKPLEDSFDFEAAPSLSNYNIGPHSGDVANQDKKAQLDKDLFNRIARDYKKEEPGQAAKKTLANLKIQEANKIIDKLQTELDKIYHSYNSQNPNRGNFAYNCLEKLNQIKQLAKTASIDQLSHFLDKYGDNLDYLSYALNDGTGNSNIYLRDLYSNLDHIIDDTEAEFTFDDWQEKIKDHKNKFEREKSNLQKEYGKKIIDLKKEFSDKGQDKGITFKNGGLVVDNQSILDEKINQLQTELFQKEHALKEEYEAHLEILKSKAKSAKNEEALENIKTQMQELQEKFANGNIDEDTFNAQLKKLQQQLEELQPKIEGFEEDNASEENNKILENQEAQVNNIKTQMQELQEKFANGNIDEDTFNAQLEKLQQQSKEFQSETNYTTEAGAKNLYSNLLNKVNAALKNRQISSIFAKRILTEYNQIFDLITQKNNALKNNSYDLVENLSKQIIQHVNRAQWFISKCEENPEWTEKDFIDGLSENEATKKFYQQIINNQNNTDDNDFSLFSNSTGSENNKEQQDQKLFHELNEVFNKQKELDQQQKQENDEDDLDKMLAALDKPSINKEEQQKKKVQENDEDDLDKILAGLDKPSINKEEQQKKKVNEQNKQNKKGNEQNKQNKKGNEQNKKGNEQNKQNKKGNEQNEQKKKDSQNFEENFKQ